MFWNIPNGWYVCLQDVEANTVRLKEHQQDVLVLEKSPSGVRPSSNGSTVAHYK